MAFLLDTNVVSETRRAAPDRNVVGWLGSAPPEQVYLSVMVIGEVRWGVERVLRRDPEQGASLATWYDELTRAFSERIVPVTAEVAERWAQLNVPDRLPFVDGLLAATALTYDWTLVTRNIKDVARTGVRLLNPFEAGDAVR